MDQLASVVFLKLVKSTCGIDIVWHSDRMDLILQEKVGQNTQTNKAPFRPTSQKKDSDSEDDEIVDDPIIPPTFEKSWSSRSELVNLVKKKDRINADNLFEHFRTLTLVDLQITEVDKPFRSFVNLGELSLSCNIITTIRSACLPKQLQILNLYGNKITKLEQCTFPPELRHLGLGFNQLSTIDGLKVSAQSLNNLISLDLSHNKLYDLTSALGTLACLPSLRQLVLLGNPLCYLKSYRAVVVSKLPNLLFLDDVEIDKQERTGKQTSEGAFLRFMVDSIAEPSYIPDGSQAVVPQQLGRCFFLHFQFDSHSFCMEPFPSWRPHWDPFSVRDTKLKMSPELNVKYLQISLHEIHFKEHIILQADRGAPVEKTKAKQPVKKTQDPKKPEITKKTNALEQRISDELIMHLAGSSESVTEALENVGLLDKSTIIGSATIDISAVGTKKIEISPTIPVNLQTLPPSLIHMKGNREEATTIQENTETSATVKLRIMLNPESDPLDTNNQ